LDGLLNGIQAAMSTVWEAIQNTLGVDLDAIQRAVNDAFQKVERDISGKLDDAKNAVKDTFRSMKQTISGLAGAFLDAARGIGNAIVDGISAGFTAKIQGFIDNLVRKMRSALQSAKDAIGIDSPSKTFADEVGAPIAQGISAGFAKGIGAFQDQLTGAIQPRVALAGGPSGALPTSERNGGGMGGHMTITVNVVGTVMSKDMADTIAKQVSRAMGNEYRRRVRS
jgi:phage-related protein